VSRLELHIRPFVVFNPADQAHLNWFAEFKGKKNR
jgi:hypothetical protein